MRFRPTIARTETIEIVFENVFRNWRRFKKNMTESGRVKMTLKQRMKNVRQVSENGADGVLNCFRSLPH